MCKIQPEVCNNAVLYFNTKVFDVSQAKDPQTDGEMKRNSLLYILYKIAFLLPLLTGPSAMYV